MKNLTVLRLWYAEQNRETKLILAKVIADKLRKETMKAVISAHVEPIAA